MHDIDCENERFRGNPEDLKEFLLLAASPSRSDEREAALRRWQHYKLGRQAAYVRGECASPISDGKRGVWKKGDYIRSLTAPAVDLSGADFKDVCLGYADLQGVRFDDARFIADGRAWVAMKGAKLEKASLKRAFLEAARLMDADLRGADLSGASLQGADLRGANLAGADLRNAVLRGADLQGVNLIRADLTGADICGSRVYGVSAWDVIVGDTPTLHRDLIVTPDDQPPITVDNIEVAQFTYLLLNNPRIRSALDTVCKKGVLILGRFTSQRKKVLDALRSELRRRDFIPIVFDFEKPSERDITETVKTLAGLSRFIIADITNPRSNPLELQATVPDYQVPFVPIILENEEPFPMFADLQNKYNWVLDLLVYTDTKSLLRVIEPAIIGPALQKHAELMATKAAGIRRRHVSAYEK